MREVIKPYEELFTNFSSHEFSQKMKSISDLLDSLPQLSEFVWKDLQGERTQSSNAGATGVPAEVVLRCALALRLKDLTFKDLEFLLVDSETWRSFCKVDFGTSISDSSLQSNVSKISAQTWLQIQMQLNQHAIATGIEDGKDARIDATAVSSYCAYPIDSKLLCDSLKIVHRCARFLRREGCSVNLPFSEKSARALRLELLNLKGREEKKPVYEKLVVGAADVWKKIPDLIAALQRIGCNNSIKKADRLTDLMGELECVLAQTIARIFDQEKVSSGDKIFSVFEPHVDAISKGNRETVFGHKVNFVTGHSGLILDAEVLEGNPADASIFLNTLERLIAATGIIPQQVVTDGGYASIDNHQDALEMGIETVVFGKSAGVTKEEMTPSEDLYKVLKNFRAGIEATISRLKRCFGLSKCRWKGFAGFKKYVYSSTVAYNLMILVQ